MERPREESQDLLLRNRLPLYKEKSLKNIESSHMCRQRDEQRQNRRNCR